MDTGFLVAVLVAAALLYDRLGGNHEVSRRLFQVGLAISLVFLVMSATAAFIRSDGAPGSFTVASSSSTINEAADRVLIASTAQYGLGVMILIVGLLALRRYHTVPLGFVLGGVFLLLTGPNLNVFSLAGYGAETSQSVDIAIFGIAVGGTGMLLAYGMQLERDFAEELENGDDEPDTTPAEDSA